MLYYLVPIRMHGEGNYQLTSVKDVKVSEEFLSLNIKDRNCQNETTLEDCKTKVYLLKVRNICQCFPFSIWSEQKVCFENLFYIILFYLNNIFNYIFSHSYLFVIKMVSFVLRRAERVLKGNA